MPCLKTKQIIAPPKSIGLRFFLQNRHLNFKIKDEIKGILSNHLILFLHRGQKDLLDTISKFFGNRYIQTFKKLPITAPIINKKKKII